MSDYEMLKKDCETAEAHSHHGGFNPTFDRTKAILSLIARVTELETEILRLRAVCEFTGVLKKDKK